MNNLYKPFKVKIAKIEKHSDDVKLFRLEKDDLFKKIKMDWFLNQASLF